MVEFCWYLIYWPFCINWTENLWRIHFVQQMHVLSGGRSRWQSLWWAVATSTQEAEPSPILYIVIKWPILYTWMEYLSCHYLGKWIADVLQPPETIHYFWCTASMSLAEQGSVTCRKYWSGQMEDRLVWGCSLEWGFCCGYWHSNIVAHQCLLCRNPLQLYLGFGTWKLKLRHWQIKGTTVAEETWFQNEPSVLAVFLLGMSCTAHQARRWSELRFPLSVWWLLWETMAFCSLGISGRALRWLLLPPISACWSER